MHDAQRGRLIPGTPIPVRRMPSAPVLAAREFVRREVASRWPDTDPAILPRVDRCVDKLLLLAAGPEYLESNALPPGPIGNESGNEVMHLAVVNGAQLVLDPRWEGRFSDDVWGLIVMGTWDQVGGLEECLGIGLAGDDRDA